MGKVSSIFFKLPPYDFAGDALSIANPKTSGDELIVVTSEAAENQVSAYRRLLAEPSTALNRIPRRNHRVGSGDDQRVFLFALQLHLRLSRCEWPVMKDCEDEHTVRQFCDFLWAIVSELLEFWWVSVWKWSNEDVDQSLQCRRRSVELAVTWPSSMEQFLDHLSGTHIFIFYIFSMLAAVVPPPSPEILQLFASSDFESEADLTSFGISASLLRKIRDLTKSSASVREAALSIMLQDCIDNRALPTGLGLKSGKSWSRSALEVCLLSFDVVRRLIQSGLNRNNAFAAQESIFHQAARDWLIQRFRLWSMPEHESDEEIGLVKAAFKFAWKSFCKPSLPPWFTTVRDLYIMIDGEFV